MEIVELPIRDKDQLEVLEKYKFQNIIFSCESTKTLSEIKQNDPELFEAIMNSNNLIQVTGGMNGPFFRFLRNNIKYNLDENKNSVTYLQKFGKTLYQIDDMKKILDIYEKIEENVNENWSDMQKVLSVYSQLQEYITSYNMKSGNYRVNSNGTMNSNNDSLLALVDNTGICDSISAVFYEAMQRIGIQNYYVVSPEHAWNIVTIKDENNKDVSFAVDLTWDVCVGERYGKKSFKNFGFPVELDDSKVSHIPSNLDDFMLFKSCKELSSEYKKEVFQSLQTGNKEKEN